MCVCICVIVVQSPSCVQLFVTPWAATHQACGSLTISRSLPKFMSIASVMPSSHLILWCPFLRLPSVFPSIRDFTNESAVHIRWPKYWSFSFSISPFQRVFRVDFPLDWLVWFPCCLRDFQESSPAPQFEGINSLVLCFFIVQLSQPYVTIGKIIALTIRTFVGRVMSLLFNTLSRFVVTFLPRSNCLLISWLQSASTMILEPKKRKSVTASTFSPPICHEGMGPDTMILVFLILSFKLALSLSSFTLIKRLFSSSSLSAIRIVSSAYLRLLMFLPPILIPACNLSSPAFLMMCSAYRLSKQNVRRHACHTSISILNQSIVPYRVLTVVSWPTNRFLRSQVMWSGIPISLRIFHSLLWSTQSKVVA